MRLWSPAPHLLAATLLLLTSTALAPPLHAQALDKFQRCNAEAKRNIRAAVGFMRDNMQVLKKDYEFNTRLPRRDNRIRRRMSRKLGKLRFSCGTGRKLCDASNDRTGFHALGTASKKLLICYKKMRDFCHLVETVAHEYGHAIGLPRKRVGRHSKDRDDLVYQYGWFAEDLCRQQGLNRDLSAPARSPRGSSPRGGLLIFPKPNYGGTPRHIRRGTAIDDMRNLGRNNSVSSLRVLSGTWELCQNKRYRGRCALFVRDLPNLKSLKFNNKVTSIRERPGAGAGWANGTPAACLNQPILFGKQFFRGRQVPLSRPIEDLKRINFRNNASSLCVPAGYRITLYNKTRYRQDPLVIRGPRAIATLKDHRRRKNKNWNNAIESLKVARER